MTTPAPPPLPPQASSGSTGFFQSRPHIQNQTLDDASWRRCFALFLPNDVQSAVYPDLERFGAYVLSPSVLAHATYSDLQPPTVQHYDTFGRRVDKLLTSEGWRASARTSAREGIVALGYDATYGQYARTYQFLKSHLWSASSCGVTCPEAMQDGAIALLQRQVAEGAVNSESTKAVLRSALRRLLSRDPDVKGTSGQWMTERPGGSDVRNTETRATFVPDKLGTAGSDEDGEGPMVASDGSPLGPWRIDGFKWFSSATDADCTVLLAKTGDSDKVSAFFAPTRIRRVGDESGESRYNGIQIQRLKNKLGTKSLPTAELVLKGMRAHLIGEIGAGTKEISSILNVTRMHTATGSCGGWGRSMAIAREYSRVRKVQGRLLMDVPAHVKAMAEQHVEYRAAMMRASFVVSLLGLVEHAVPAGKAHLDWIPGHDEARALIRLLTPMIKSTVSLAAITGIRACMESMGGIGYLENEDPELNIAKIFRDSCVNAIWEGTTDVLAADIVRVLMGKGGKPALQALRNWVEAFTSGDGQKLREYELDTIKAEHTVFEKMTATNDAETLLYHGRDIMHQLAWLVSAIVLCRDAMTDGDTIAGEIARRWLQKRIKQNSHGAAADSWRDQCRRDREIVFADRMSKVVESKL